jgi:hypothetical protein
MLKKKALKAQMLVGGARAGAGTPPEVEKA